MNCGEFTYRANVHAPAHSEGQQTLAKIRQTTQRAQLAPPAVMPFLWKKLFFSMVRHAWWLNVALVHFTDMALKFQLSKAAGHYHPNRPRNQLLRPFNSTTGTRGFEACGAEYLPLPFVDRSETLLIAAWSNKETNMKPWALSWAVFSAGEPVNQSPILLKVELSVSELLSTICTSWHPLESTSFTSIPENQDSMLKSLWEALEYASTWRPMLCCNRLRTFWEIWVSGHSILFGGRPLWGVTLALFDL